MAQVLVQMSALDLLHLPLSGVPRRPQQQCVTMHPVLRIAQRRVQSRVMAYAMLLVMSLPVQLCILLACAWLGCTLQA